MKRIIPLTDAQIAAAKTEWLATGGKVQQLRLRQSCYRPLTHVGWYNEPHAVEGVQHAHSGQETGSSR